MGPKIIERIKKLNFRKRNEENQNKELRPQALWRSCERVVQAKFPNYPKGTAVGVQLSNPDIVEPILARAGKKEVPGILCKVINDIEEDRQRGKRLVKEALLKSGNPFLAKVYEEQLEETSKAMPVTITKLSTPVSQRGRAEAGEKVVETRELTRAEISQIRGDFSQKQHSDVDYLDALWTKGATGLKLTAEEMKQINLTVEHPNLQEALRSVIELDEDETRSLFAWIARAWVQAFPYLDLASIEPQARWSDPVQGIRVIRKIGLLCKMYEDNPELHPLTIRLTPAMRNIIVRGAPESMRMFLAGSIAGMHDLQEVTDCLRQYRDLSNNPRAVFATQMYEPFPSFQVTEASQVRAPFQNIRVKNKGRGPGSGQPGPLSRRPPPPRSFLRGRNGEGSQGMRIGFQRQGLSNRQFPNGQGWKHNIQRQQPRFTSPVERQFHCPPGRPERTDRTSSWQEGVKGRNFVRGSWSTQGHR